MARAAPLKFACGSLGRLEWPLAEYDREAYAVQGDFSTLMAKPCAALDHPLTSDPTHCFYGSALPASTKFWRSVKLKNEDWGSTVFPRADNAAESVPTK